jgi:selenide,water dikinase
MSPAALDRILSRLPVQDDPCLIVGYGGKDDAGVYLIRDHLALVQTVDFFTPIVDDPYHYGQIAAANSLSDIYAMGGRPVTSLSIVCYPEDGDFNVLENILRGGLDKMKEAGCTIVGGHTVRDSDVKFGYAVTGTVDPQRVWTNGSACPGDSLFLTKPLGTGVLTTALRAGKAESKWIDRAVEVMRQLNREAAAALAAIPDAIHAVTDISGFGLLGHAWEMATASSVSLRLSIHNIDLLEGAIECARAGFLAGGLKKNQEFISGCTRFSENISTELQNLLFDPQTSGGLLVAVDPNAADDAKAALEKADCYAMRIGEAMTKTAPIIDVFL